MMTNRITGYFDTRIYNEKKERSAWKFKGEDETIAFTATFADASLPRDLSEFAREYESKGSIRYRVIFKISSRCVWFDEKGHPVAKPSNELLDGKKYEVQIDYNTLHGAEGTKEARGYWANAIQYREAQAYVFAPMDGSAEVPQVARVEVPKDEESGLPF